MPESLPDHARRQDLRRNIEVLRRRVAPVLAAWWLVVVAFAIGLRGSAEIGLAEIVGRRTSPALWWCFC